MSSIVSLSYNRLCIADGLMCIAVRAESVTVVMEFSFPLLLHNLSNSLLYQSVQNGRNTQLTFAAIRFRDFYP